MFCGFQFGGEICSKSCTEITNRKKTRLEALTLFFFSTYITVSEIARPDVFLRTMFCLTHFSSFNEISCPFLSTRLQELSRGEDWNEKKKRGFVSPVYFVLFFFKEKQLETIRFSKLENFFRLAYMGLFIN